MGPDEGAFVFADDGVDFFSTVDRAAGYLEAVDVEDGVYEAFFTPTGERLNPRVLDEQKVTLDRSNVTDLDALRALLRRESGERSTFTSSPDDPIAVANEFLTKAWDGRWPRWPRWLDRRLHGTRPSLIEPNMAETATLRSALSTRDVALLEQAVEAQRPEFRGLLDRSMTQVSADDLNNLREAVAERLAMRGFGPDWEPNDFGLECEALIDRLAPWHWGKDL